MLGNQHRSDWVIKFSILTHVAEGDGMGKRQLEETGRRGWVVPLKHTKTLSPLSLS